MSEFSDYYENKIIDHMFRNQAFTVPTALYLALFTGSTGLEADNPTLEVSGNAYARQAITLGAPSGGVSTNSGAITFPAATPGAWGDITHVAIVDHVSNTTWGTNVHVLTWTPIVTTTIGIGGVFNVPNGYLILTVA